MSQPFVGQLLLASFNFAPKGFAQCNGQLMAINQNQALFSLLGTTYGGDGRVNFGLPNLQGRTPVGAGNGIVLGQVGGEDAHTLNQNEVPPHTHQLMGTLATATTDSPNGALAAATTSLTPYTSASGLVQMNPASISTVGSSQPHENRQPFLVMNWCIALQGIFPSQN
jgi:microcystin-dependent protein